MYIKRICLENIKGFSKLDFDLDRGGENYAGWTVFTGDNGSGKSTLLKAMTIALTGKETARALQPSFQRWIRSSEKEASIQLEIVPHRIDDFFSDSGKTTYNPFPAKILLSNGNKEPSIQAAIPNGRSTKFTCPDRSIWSFDSRGWFSCAYGPFRRILGASPEAQRGMIAPNTERYVTMFREDASLAEVDRWLRDLKYKELEGDEIAKQYLSVLLELLQDELMPNQISIDRVDSDGMWLKDRTGLALAWHDMSDGYRAALAFLTDIVRHIIKAYGPEGLFGRGDDNRLFIKRSGVVMIDEIDAHLHPEWQREIGFWLTRHFPNIQFLVTTHSPLICQAASKKGLFVLPEPGSDIEPRQLTDDEYRKVVAARADTILLSPAFGLQNTRSPKAVEVRAEYSTLKAKQRAGAQLTPEESGKYKQLEMFIDPDEEA